MVVTEARQLLVSLLSVTVVVLSAQAVRREREAAEAEAPHLAGNAPDSVRTTLPSATLHTRTELSFPAEASSVPSSEKDKDLTVATAWYCGGGAWWPVRVRRSMPSAARQSLIVPSSPPEAMMDPSGEYWTPVAECACPPRIQRTSGRSASAGPAVQNSEATITDAVHRSKRSDFTGCLPLEGYRRAVPVSVHYRF